MSKFIWEITPQDLLEHSIWQLPYWEDDSVEESVVAPASKADALDPNSELLVKANFTDSKGSEFLGYIRFGLAGIENTQPCMFVSGMATGFWFGFSKPEYSELQQLDFPITGVTESEYGLPSQVEIIEGYGYLDANLNNKVVYC
ncbi:hypothetical protein GCM10007978_49950 [Shewanella hanedai]|uniref:hypothetical protein n=1 Tax=Shewanella hanedai TaxID=25 RepID=UPI0016634EAB|nr:hypothetical protein [Shewanella hanedai]GGJ06455.1 hypothetical protein GCM10007978_49950 [Shewanella hanedai]